MTPERARQVANGVLAVAGVTLAIVVWRQPALRRLVRHFAPVALREIRPVHVAAVMAAIAAAPAAAATASAAADAAADSVSGASAADTAAANATANVTKASDT
jgi:hypothetical protein